jgi:hypothetical protein
VNQQRIAAGSPASPEEARELALMCQWRPMETAPRSGVFVLGYDPLIGCVIARWDKDYEDWAGEDGQTVEPSHWLPLPAAPNKEN